MNKSQISLKPMKDTEQPIRASDNIFADLGITNAEGRPDVPPDMRALAAQILNLTKLNWASTDSVCGEPITTKYAGDIAYLIAAFLRQSSYFSLHPVLEKTPWFI